MLITFKSRASGDVIMLENNGEEMLSLFGKNPTDTKGIVTVEQLPGAISALKSATQADLATQREPANGDEQTETGNPVSLHQRTLPLLELLERSLKDNVPVTWGV
ncbi:SSU ribosomal protein S5p (S2e) [Georgfuchsia toluolica]|uniref:SSU ribosomal protein S5p (S2e) n=1 Tax=Georgfuchsia toluolica TaxID=424218 RepID=A0A916J1H7_9PROT|nr:DUF1840 domain-containing protein [Georgfuchsia toluolica]CAG4882400.1 SSU ribosomal protein S5p (S2e) [Georgfuchsia toluolica]